jgi:hypothetical protein
MLMELYAFKHEVPGSSPGGSNNVRGANWQSTEFHQNLVVALLSQRLALTFDKILSQARFFGANRRQSAVSLCLGSGIQFTAQWIFRSRKGLILEIPKS